MTVKTDAVKAEIKAWPPLKKAIWDVVIAEELNGPTYVNAWDLVDKLYLAALSASPAGVKPKALEIVPTYRLERFIGTGDPTADEAHDMAVEILNHRQAARIMIAIEPAGVGVETPPPSTHVAGRWLPIEQADKTINHVTEFTEIGLTLKNSDTFWVRDEDGRVYQAAWSEGNNGRDYWWDWEAESPVDPVEFMPHPLDPRFAALATTEGSDNG